MRCTNCGSEIQNGSFYFNCGTNLEAPQGKADNGFKIDAGFCSPDFFCKIQDTFDIKNRGIVVTGQIKIGTVNVGDQVDLIDSSNQFLQTAKISGIEMFRKVLQSANVGDNVGLLVAGIKKEAFKNAAALIICNCGNKKHNIKI
jgi:translation elongation factor EF-Tu-like GTPase